VSDTKTLPPVPPITNDNQAREIYRAVLERAGYAPQIASSIAQEMFSVFTGMTRDVAPIR